MQVGRFSSSAAAAAAYFVAQTILAQVEGTHVGGQKVEPAGKSRGGKFCLGEKKHFLILEKNSHVY